MTNKSNTLYIGVTNDLERRINEHKLGTFMGFTHKYKINRLIYYEEYIDVDQAIAREKQLKSWSRNKKISLIKKLNPEFKDLSI